MTIFSALAGDVSAGTEAATIANAASPRSSFLVIMSPVVEQMTNAEIIQAFRRCAASSFARSLEPFCLSCMPRVCGRLFGQIFGQKKEPSGLVVFVSSVESMEDEEMNKTLVAAISGAAILVGTQAALAQVQTGPIVREEVVVPAPTVGMAPAPTTGAERGPGSLYDASPTNGTNPYQAPPEGEQGPAASRFPGDVPQKPPG